VRSDRGVAIRARKLSRAAAVAGLGGLIVLAILGVTGVFNNGDAYGRLDLPGTKVLHFPSGQVEISFETRLTTDGGGGLTVPALSLRVAPADGRGPDPRVVQSYGATITVNSDAHERVWKMRVATAGDYRVTASGELSAYVDPQLTFGHEASLGPFFALATAILCCGLLGAVVAGRSLANEGGPARRAPGPPPTATTPTTISGVPGHAASVVAPRPIRPPPPTGHAPASATSAPAPPSPVDAILMRLDKLADLRERGALTDAEFAAEKARILER
jgi:putative oligomerization/nucleic acid binding protein